MNDMDATTETTEFKGYYFSTNKAPEAMTMVELDWEVESAEGYFDRCREIEQGINSKEWVRYRRCIDRLAVLGRYVEPWR